MARNLSAANLKKLASIEVNGYKADIANYVYNPSYEHEYPHLRKEIAENEFSTVYYFKHYDGTGEYIHAVYKGDGSNGWQIIKNVSEKVIEAANRFSMKKLMELAGSL